MDKAQELFNRPLATLGEVTLTYGQLFLAPLLLLLYYLLAKWIGRIMVKRMTHAGVNPDLIHLVQRFYLIAVIAIFVVTVLELLNVPLAAFAFISGAVAIGVGFGAQNIINNFISGWILMWERPIRIDDFVEVGTTMGTVEAINTRSTRIRRTDGVHLLIPNSYLLENMVVNWTLVDKRTRTSVRVGVAYGSPVKRVQELILQAVTEHEHVLKEPKPLVIFDSFGDSALEFETYFWALAAGEKDLRSIRSELRFRIDELFRENDIVIAFPQRDLHLDTLKPLDVRILHDRFSRTS
jgi:small-conductance mechanosensitive channel